jgi:hypothetical protein
MDWASFLELLQAARSKSKRSKHEGENLRIGIILVLERGKKHTQHPKK